GEVIAEVCAAQLEPYLGLRYPAGDIPPQARRLYLRQRVCAMADSGSEPVPLLVDPGLDDGTALDLTHSALRSISPIHREYMRNMKNAASLTVALAPGPDLWGMLVCHHATARVAGPELRAAVDIFGQVVSLLLGSLALAEVHAQRAARSATLRALIDRLAAPMAVAEALAAAEAELLQVVGAAGAVVRFSGTLRCLGRTPPPLAVERALAVLQVEPGSDMLALDDLGLRHPELAACRSEGSGALLLPLAHGADDAILWFRPELLLTVAWAGNPAEHVTADPVTGRLSPRASFAAWRETMRGRSAPWAQSDLALARDVRSAVQAELAQRAEAELCVARTELERSKQLVLACVEDALVSLTIADATRPDWPLIYVNRMFLQMTGYEVGEVIGRNGRFLQGPATDPKGVAELRRAVSAGEKAEVQVINYRKDGTRFLNRLLLEPIHDDAGRLAAYRGRQFDVTLEAKQKAAEGQRQKMEALGRLSGGVAHEINNMLQPVTLLGQDVIDRGLVNDEGRQHLEIVLECAKNARRIIGDLLTFSRPTPRRAELHDPIVLLDDSLRLVRPAIPHGVALKVCIVGRPPAVTIDSTWFVQILLNLVTNAAAAMGGRGEVTIELEDVHGTGKSAGRERAGFVRLRVIDTGCGMDRTTLDRAFEPFFTTKAVGEGTGLGLPLVYGLVQEMGGSIELESEPGRGTTVTMWIPAPDGERNDGIDIGH
ncbi:MAG: ATP-binding protein, partial [Xanthobacteraceae bacterium]